MRGVFGQISQVGYVSGTARASMDDWLRREVGPWFYIERVDWTTHCQALYDRMVALDYRLASEGRIGGEARPLCVLRDRAGPWDHDQDIRRQRPQGRARQALARPYRPAALDANCGSTLIEHSEDNHLAVITALLIPLTLSIFFPARIRVVNYLVLLPALLWLYVVLPLGIARGSAGRRYRSSSPTAGPTYHDPRPDPGKSTCWA
jgi:hypothetical protein